MRKNARGDWQRDIGLKPDGRVPRFYLGRDDRQAELREKLLEEVWRLQRIRWERADSRPPMWDDPSLQIAHAVARGEVRVKLRRPTPHPTLQAMGAGGTPPEHLAHWDAEWLRELQADFPVVVLEFPEMAPHAEAQLDARLDREAGELRARMQAVERLRRPVPPPAPAAPVATLHQALDSYSEYLISHHRDGDRVSQHGEAALRRVAMLRGHHADCPLAALDAPALDRLWDYWRQRPVSKRGKPIAPSTAVDMLKRLRVFLAWLHRSPAFPWRRPEDWTPPGGVVKLTQAERAARIRVQTYSDAELALLWAAATPRERLFLVLGLNCGFAAAEVASLQLSEIHLRQPHGHYPGLDGSWIKRERGKNGVFGEWRLWPITVAGIEWALARRPADTAETALLLSPRTGRPLSEPTRSNNRNPHISNAWARLTARVKKEHPEFRRLAFKHIRKTAANLIRQTAGGEVSAVFMCHGKPVSDELSDIYTERPFDRVFEALDAVAARLAPMLTSLEDPFPPTPPSPGARLAQGKVERIRQLRRQGFTVVKIAQMVGVNRDTVLQYSRSMEHPTGEER